MLAFHAQVGSDESVWKGIRMTSSIFVFAFGGIDIVTTFASVDLILVLRFGSSILIVCFHCCTSWVRCVQGGFMQGKQAKPIKQAKQSHSRHGAGTAKSRLEFAFLVSSLH